MSDERTVILFDADCGLCQGACSTVARRDRAGRFRMVPLRSAEAAALLRARGIRPPAPGESLDTMIVLDGDQVLVRSDAALRIAGGLPFPWPVLTLARWVPRRVREEIYRFVAAHRSRWFGRCAVSRAPQR